MTLKDILIWIAAICLSILIWPLVLSIIAILLYAVCTIGLVVVIAILIKRGIDGPR